MIDFTLFPSPCYIMEEELLRKNLTLIKSVADRAGVEIILAFKSFAMWRSFPIFREYIEHSTASSVYEARLALEEFGSKAHTYSPAYTEADFPEIMRCSSHITFNSLSQFHRFYPMVEAEGSGISCGIRVNPEYSEVETELYNPCAPGTRFGVMAEQLPDRLPQGIEGFHCHCHCESSSYELERTLVHLEEKFARWFPQLKWLNLGGGHLMTRKDYDVEHLIGLLQGLRKRYPNLRIILEPGSAFTWQTGVLTGRVWDRRRISARKVSEEDHAAPRVPGLRGLCPAVPRREKAHPLARHSRRRARPMTSSLLESTRPLAQHSCRHARPMTSRLPENARPLARHSRRRARPMTSSLLESARPLAQRPGYAVHGGQAASCATPP